MSKVPGFTDLQLEEEEKRALIEKGYLVIESHIPLPTGFMFTGRRSYGELRAVISEVATEEDWNNSGPLVTRNKKCPYLYKIITD